MKTPLLTVLGLCLAGGLLQAQTPADTPPSNRTPAQLQELLGPVALYPDPLVSLVLPASTVPTDITLADRFVIAGGDPAEVEGKPWDSSVKALTRYPDTLKWLDDNLDWTSQVGDAFASQPADVMEALQALRAKAKAMGNLVDTPEERVVQDDSAIRIVPAQPDAIYVPSYDPEVVYVQQAPAEPLVYFSEPYAVGPWLGYDFDWHRHHLYRGEWNRGWDYGGGSRGGNVSINSNISNSQVWQVNATRRQAAVRRSSQRQSAVAQGAVSIAHPARNLVARHQGESIRRAQASNGGGLAAAPVVRTPQGTPRAGQGGKGHVVAQGASAAAIRGGAPQPRTNTIRPRGPAPQPGAHAYKAAQQPPPPARSGQPLTAAPQPRASAGPHPKVQSYRMPQQPKAQPLTTQPKPAPSSNARSLVTAAQPKAGAAPHPKVQSYRMPQQPKAVAHQSASKPAPPVAARSHATAPQPKAKAAPHPKVQSYRTQSHPAAQKPSPQPKVRSQQPASKPKTQSHKAASKPAASAPKAGKKKKS